MRRVGDDAERWRRVLAAAGHSYGYFKVSELVELGLTRHHIARLARTAQLESTSYGLYRVGGYATDWRSLLYRLTSD